MNLKSNTLAGLACLTLAALPGCASMHDRQKPMHDAHMAEMMARMEHARAAAETPEYFLLRPELEKAYGYSHAIKVGRSVKISGAVSMDEAGNPTAAGDMEQQMKNAYGDLEQVLAHFGLTFENVVVENVFTTDMAKFIEVSGPLRGSLYGDQFPTGTWLEVKGLVLPEFMIEIELEAHVPD